MKTGGKPFWQVYTKKKIESEYFLDQLYVKKDNKAPSVSSWDQLHVDKNAETQTDSDPFWEQLHVETTDKHSSSDQALT